MTLEHDDSRLTAYALEELGPAEAAEVEALLEADPGARAAVEAIRAEVERHRSQLVPGEDQLAERINKDG